MIGVSSMRRVLLAGWLPTARRAALTVVLLLCDPACSAGLPSTSFQVGVHSRMVVCASGCVAWLRGGTSQVFLVVSLHTGETLVVSMWVTSPTTVVFQTSVKERPGATAISGAAVEFQPGTRLQQQAGTSKL